MKNTQKVEAIIEEQLERVSSFFSDEDKKFNSRMVAEGRKATGKDIIPSVTEHHCKFNNTSTKNNEKNDDYDFISKIL